MGNRAREYQFYTGCLANVNHLPKRKSLSPFIRGMVFEDATCLSTAPEDGAFRTNPAKELAEYAHRVYN
jgi:hypothetical protein